MLVGLPVELVEGYDIAVYFGMLEVGAYMNDKHLLTVELLEAAQNCGQSLQRALALPGMAALCAGLADALETRSWKPGRHTRFAVQEPKLREIFAPDFADRVVEGWLVSLVEQPLSRLLIDDSFANRKGKGNFAAIQTVQRRMRQPGSTCYLQLDVRSFFHSIHRPTLLDGWVSFLQRLSLTPERLELASYVSTVLLERDPAKNHHTVRNSRSLLAQIPARKNLLGSPPDTGLPIGSAASQHFANFYLNGLDHFIKHELCVKGYTRYMDDLLLLGPNAATLVRWRDAIAAYMHDRLRLSLHPGKEQMGKSSQGVTYLGYTVYPHHLHVCQRNVSALKSRLDFFKHLLWPEQYPYCQKPLRGAWDKLVHEGELRPPVPPEWRLFKRMEATINSYLGLMGHARSYTLRKQLYERHFGPLKGYFLPAGADYSSVRLKAYLL